VAKNFIKKDEKKNSLYPSDYGSHLSMLNEEETSKLKDENLVALSDNVGVYVTKRSSLDNGLADPNRYSNR